ncbi:MAG: phenylacetic acid degradation operon negative regulatory protein PaaX [Luminiphilus sp.]|nr:phenylacetic acid degradation operon negative regulatory protein PaaX [Luminiphilus sp.]
MTIKKQLQPIIRAFRQRQPMRAKSLIITFFGDVVSQHGREIWLGSAATALQGLGINDRLVRTSVFRLTKEGWLEVDREGRRSFYRFSNFGSLEYQRAARRIYSARGESWQGRWQLLIPTTVDEKIREDLRRSLNWLGFRTITPGTYARPGGDLDTIKGLLDEFNIEQSVVLMDAETSSITTKKALREVVSEHWKLDELAADYADFIRLFGPLGQAISKGKKPTPEEAFQARLLLIHEYRRILLRDTPLPEDLLPNRWKGTVARQIVSSLYRALAEPSEAFVVAELENLQGHLPTASGSFYQRFK